jgi:hypothetical protein
MPFAEVNFPYKIGVTTLYFSVLDDVQNILDKTTNRFVAPIPGNEDNYKVTLEDVHDWGAYWATVPLIHPDDLPVQATVLIYDSAIGPDPIGMGQMTIRDNNNEVGSGIIAGMPSDQVLECIYASTVGNNDGVGTDTENYYGPNDILAFTTTFDTNGNRQVLING